jgi:hypothetical protein
VALFGWIKGDDEAAPAPVVPPAPTPDDIVAALDQVDQSVTDPTLPSPVVARVRRVTDRLRQTVPRMDNAGLTSVDQYALIATATSYLPESLSGYLRLPRDWANTRPIAQGKTSLLILIDQLDLLGLTVDRMYDAVLQKDARALVAQGRFLRQKFAPEASAETRVDALADPPSDNPLDLEVW